MDFFYIRNIDEVLSTGGCPTERDHIDQLKKEGFSTIVSLEPLTRSLADYTRSQSLKVVTLSVGWHKAVPQDKIKRFLSLAALAQARKRKIFLHCLQGRDRTGEMRAAYMIAKKSFARAKELGLIGPLRLGVRRRMDEMQEHFERTLNRAKKYRRRP